MVASWATLGLFGVVSMPGALGLHAVDTTAAVVSLGLFLVSLPIWVYAFGLALVRSARGDDIVVSSWVFLNTSAPADVRRHLLGATAACVVIGLVAAWANAFGVLVPMLQLGFCALWGARHGVYPARRVTPDPRAVGGRRR